jgi:hypothetical protein
MPAARADKNDVAKSFKPASRSGKSTAWPSAAWHRFRHCIRYDESFTAPIVTAQQREQNVSVGIAQEDAVNFVEGRNYAPTQTKRVLARELHALLTTLMTSLSGRGSTRTERFISKADASSSSTD